MLTVTRLGSPFVNGGGGSRIGAEALAASE